MGWQDLAKAEPVSGVASGCADASYCTISGGLTLRSSERQ